MKATVQYRRGLAEAVRITGKSARQASLDAGFNADQFKRFVSGKTDIKLGTLEKLCEFGFGLPMESVFRLGK